MNYYGQNTYSKHITLFRDQLDCAFSSSAEFSQFVSMVMSNASDMIEQILLQKIEAEDLTEEVLSYLDPEDQELIRQIREDGLSRTELAEKHQVTPSALYTKISRLRNRVRSIIQDVLNRKL